MNFNEWLDKNGWDRSTLSDGQLTALQAAWRAQEGRPAPTPADNPPVSTPANNSYEQVMAEFRRDEERRREVTTLVASALKQYPNQADRIDQIGRLAMEGKWDIKDTKIALMEATRVQAPTPLSRGGRELSQQVIEAAFAQAAGVQETTLVKQYGEQTMQQAHTAFRGGLTFSELLNAQARQNGYHDANIKHDHTGVLRAAFLRGQPMAMGFSNVSLPGIFSNTAKQLIQDAFNFGDQSWREVCAIRSTNDFKQVQSYGLIGDYDFVEIAPDGRIPHAVPGEIGYTNQVTLAARMLVLTFVDITNDDLGALNSKGTKLGLGAIRAWNKKFWRKWNVLTNFNTVEFGNYAAGAGTAFSADALDTAVQMFRSQKVPLTEADGVQTQSEEDPLGVRPAKLVVPPIWDNAATRLMNSEWLGDAEDQGIANPFAGKYQVIAPDYMHETSLGGVNTQWSLIANPLELPCIEAAFLRGNQTPTIENVDVDGDQLGIAMRGWWANGVNLQEHRARVVMKGKA